MHHARRKSSIADIATYVLLLLAIAIWSVPVIWVVVTSIKPRKLIFNDPPTLFFLPTLNHYIDAFKTGGIIDSIVNSLIISVSSTALAMIIATPAAYAFARLRFRMRTPLTFYTLLMQMAPPIGLLIPFYYGLSKIDLLDSYIGLITIYLTITIPFSVWLMMTYFAEIPFELEEAAAIDGASRFEAFFRVIMPLARGGIAVTTIFAFINAWNDFLFAVVLSGPTTQPATVAIFSFLAAEESRWGPFTATAVMIMAPVVTIALFAQKHIVHGLSKIDLLDSYIGLITIYLTITIPFSVWLMMTYFAEIPFELEEAAAIDGASRFEAFFRVIMPLARGGIAVTTIFAFINAWNDFLFAVVLSGPTTQPATVAIFSFLAAEESRWGPFTATAVMIMAPVVTIALFAQKHIVHGLSMGGVKG